MNTVDYKFKYIKYKNKYIQLKKHINGGAYSYHNDFDKYMEEAIQASLKSSISREGKNFNTYTNNGVPVNYPSDRFTYENQCFWISLLDFFSKIKNQPYFILDGTAHPLNIDSIRFAFNLEVGNLKDIADISDDITLSGSHIQEKLKQFCHENNVFIRIYSYRKFRDTDLANADKNGTISNDASIDIGVKNKTAICIPIVMYGLHFELIKDSPELASLNLGHLQNDFTPEYSFVPNKPLFLGKPDYVPSDKETDRKIQELIQKIQEINSTILMGERLLEKYQLKSLHEDDQEKKRKIENHISTIIIQNSRKQDNKHTYEQELHKLL